MQLIRAFRLPDAPRIAIVGAGGKTGLLFALAREFSGLEKTVVMTTTTHLAEEEVQTSRTHLIPDTRADLAAILDGELRGEVLITGPVSGDGRYTAPPPEILSEIDRIATAHSHVVLIECDGSRRRPLKAPGAHEPVIPAFSDHVLVVAGLAGIGRPLTSDAVHRPERFAQLSRVLPGTPISPDSLAKVLIHPEGGLKGIPPGAVVKLLLNQADDENRQIYAHQIAQAVKAAYSGIIVGDIRREADREGSQSRQDQAAIKSVHERVAGVVLAAGSSTRFGGSVKQLLPWGEETLVRRVTRTALAAGLSPVIAVVGSDAEPVTQAIEDLPIHIVVNRDWQDGQSASVSAAVENISSSIGGALFLLADQPQLPQELIRALVERHTRTLAPIVAPRIAGRRGNPVLFDRVTFGELMKVSGDKGGRALLNRFRVEWVDWYDEGLLLDIDTPEDYSALTAMYQQ